MAAVLAAFDDAENALQTLHHLQNSVFAGQVNSKLRAFSSNAAEVAALRAAFPAIRVRLTKRLLDSHEGGANGALIGIVAGVLFTQFAGYGMYLIAQALPAGSWAADLRTGGTLSVLFLGFIGAVLGGLLGYMLGKRLVGLHPDLVRRYEQRLERGETIVAINQELKLTSYQRRLKPLTHKRATSSMERLRYWLGEHGAHDTRQVQGTVKALRAYDSTADVEIPISPFMYALESEDDENDSSLRRR